MSINEFLLVPENRNFVQVISQQILAEVEPDEMAETVDFIDPLIDMAIQGKAVLVDTSDEAGGFGGIDLMVMVVVPVVVTVLGNLLTELGKSKIEDIKKQNKQVRPLIREVTYRDIEPTINRVKSIRGRKKIHLLIKALNKAIEKYMES